MLRFISCSYTTVAILIVTIGFFDASIVIIVSKGRSTITVKYFPYEQI